MSMIVSGADTSGVLEVATDADGVAISLGFVEMSGRCFPDTAFPNP